MKQILVLGAGKSSSVLINYLIEESQKNQWKIIVADSNLNLANSKVYNNSNSSAIQLDIYDDIKRTMLIESSDLVISLLPATLHYMVAENCVKLGKHLITASYTTTDINDLDKLAKENGSIVLMEMGLDPGIDHMSAMKEIDQIKEIGGVLTSFKSYCGGLVAPDSDNNIWNYKFTWNPRNVILAGQGIAAKYLYKGSLKFAPYHKLFSRSEEVLIGNDKYEGYVNRDSLKYLDLYNLSNVKTFIRGTLRRQGFCEAWNVLVQLGITDDTYVIENTKGMTYEDFYRMFFPNNYLWMYMKIQNGGDAHNKMVYIGLFSKETIERESGTPAQILQEILEKKLSLEPNDKDMIVMLHEMEYVLNGELKTLTSSLKCIGDDSINTAMAKTVGLPIGIATKMILNGHYNNTGVHIPTTKDLYVPILNELEKFNVKFNIK